MHTICCVLQEKTTESAIYYWMGGTLPGSRVKRPADVCQGARGSTPGTDPKRLFAMKGRQNVGVRNQVPNIIWGTDDLPPLQGEFMMLDLTGGLKPRARSTRMPGPSVGIGYEQPAA